MRLRKITEEEFEQIKLDIDHNFSSPTMKSGLMDVYHNDTDNFIDDLDDFSSITDDS